MDCSNVYPCPLPPIPGPWQFFLELFSILFLGVWSICVSHYQPLPPCWCLTAQRTGDPLFKLQTPQICLRCFASPNQPQPAPKHSVSLLSGEISIEGYPLPSSPIQDLYLWKFWKYRRIRYKSSPPLLRVTSPTELSKPLKTTSLPITPNLKCFHHHLAELLEEYFRRILFQYEVYGKYCGQCSFFFLNNEKIYE
jgi:hypothetical protein